MKTTTTTKLGFTLAGVLALTITSAYADTFGSGLNTFTIDFVTIGDPGNPVDTGTTGVHFSSYGAVAYTFQMGKYEVSNDMVNKANTLGSLGMTPFAPLATNAAAGNMGFNQAARFANWLNTSKGYAPAYKFTLQPGDGGYTGNENLSLWVSGDAGYDASNPYRNSNAFYFVPSENEWYKAAYYSGSGTTYYDYPGGDTFPSDMPGGPGANVTAAGSLTHYGTIGQGGNASEILESAFTAPNDSPSEDRVLRGGNWFEYSLLPSSGRGAVDPAYHGNQVIGFRVASVVPEPTSALLLLGSGAMLLLRRRRVAA